MSYNNPTFGEGYGPAYQISATPFVTSSQVTLGQIKQIEFGHVTRFVTIKNNSPSTVLSVGFTENGLKSQNSNYFFLSGSESFSAEIRVDRVFLSGSSGASNFTVLAGMTTIPVSNFLLVTGSNGYIGVG
jgi:hypothetical protein